MKKLEQILDLSSDKSGQKILTLVVIIEVTVVLFALFSWY